MLMMMLNSFNIIKSPVADYVSIKRIMTSKAKLVMPKLNCSDDVKAEQVVSKSDRSKKKSENEYRSPYVEKQTIK